MPNAIAQRIELTSTPFNDGEVFTIRHEQIMLLLTGAPRGTDYQVTLDGTEVGAAWKKTARESGKAYLSVKRVSPFLAVPINCAVMAQEDGSLGRALRSR